MNDSPKTDFFGTLQSIARKKSVQIIFALFLFYFLLLLFPYSPRGNAQYVSIPEGTSLKEAGSILEKERGITSSALFTLYSKLFLSGTIQYGTYHFGKRETVFSTATRLSKGDYGVLRRKVLFPEGITTREMAEICSRELFGCKKGEFIQLAEGKEGYLFPDTYFFLETSDASEVIKMLSENFNQKTASFEKSILGTRRTKSEIIIMASILEEEGKSESDWKKISGILWKRLSLGMPLQVDASLGYVTGKGSLELTQGDLATTSLYNTYRFKGLPPTPISNPGLKAIEAAISPEKSPYFFYLSDKTGKIHYAKTFSEHILNKQRYL